MNKQNFLIQKVCMKASFFLFNLFFYNKKTIKISKYIEMQHQNIFQAFSPTRQTQNGAPTISVHSPIMQINDPIRYANPSQSYSPSFSKQFNTKSKIKMTTAMDSEDPTQNNFELTLMTKAVNNSFMRRLSGDESKFQTNQLVKVIAQYGINSFIPNLSSTKVSSERIWKKYDDTPHFIVQLNEDLMKGVKGSSWGLFNCGKIQNNDNINKEQYVIGDNNNLKLYSLIFELGRLQFHFQSLLDQNKKIFLNVDTVPLKVQCIISSQPQYQKTSWKNPILLYCLTDPSLYIPIYITPKTLPYPLSEQKLSQTNKYLEQAYYKLLQLMNTIIDNSRGKRLHVTKIQQIILQNEYKFFEKRFVTQQQFVNYCQTGDILLFKGKHLMGKMQRFFTNSEYDHVGIVYKSQQYGICIFQSNSGLGVAMAIWKQLIRYKWYQGLQGIVWRKLKQNEKGKDFEKKVTEFIKANLHKEFGLNLPKLLKFKSVTITHDGSQKKSYFCSELVATIYKHLGFLQKTKSATQYWPKDFADGNGIQIINGALDPEREIIFDKQLLKNNYPYLK